MSDIKELTEKIVKFRDARDWKQFHNPKNSAIALLSEATEVLDQFKWLNDEEMRTYVKEGKKEISDELSDVLFWILLMAHDLDIDIKNSFNVKMRENARKYPVKKSRGKHIKYDKL